MAEAAPQTEGNEARRRAMLQAAAELITERGFGETRIADVAKRAGTSSGLVIYYFGTRDRLLVDALRYSEESYYDAAAKLLGEEQDFRKRLSMLVEWSCVPELPGEVSGSWGLWLDLWSTALRHPEVREARVELDARWRDLARAHRPRGQGRRRRRRRHRRAPVRADLHRAPRRPLHPGRPQRREITSDVAYDIGMEYAEQRLGLSPSSAAPSPASADPARPTDLLARVTCRPAATPVASSRDVGQYALPGSARLAR